MALATALDLINGTLNNVSTQLDANFDVYPTLYNALSEAGHVKFGGGAYLEFPFTYGAAGSTRGIFNGPEILPKGRSQKHQKLSYELHRMVHTLHIPNRELVHNTGENARIDLIDEYPAKDMLCLIQDQEDFLLTGVSGGLAAPTADILGLFCLNGEFSTGVLQGTTNGALDFAPPSAQADVVGNVQKQQSRFHYNQYGLITSWPSNGLKTVKRIMRTCAKNGGHKDCRTYIVIMDDITYGNFEDEKYGNVRITMVNDATEQDATYSLPLMGAEVHHSLHLDTAQFTGTGSNGVSYIIDKDHFFCQEAEKLQVAGRKFQESEDQDVVYMKVPWHLQYGMRRFPAHGVVAGGN